PDTEGHVVDHAIAKILREYKRTILKRTSCKSRMDSLTNVARFVSSIGLHLKRSPDSSRHMIIQADHAIQKLELFDTCCSQEHDSTQQSKTKYAKSNCC